MTASGARPAGAVDEADAALAVREMFDGIAPRYDLLNHLLSLNIDRLWWWRTARRFRQTLERPEAVVVDLCCGTGDMTLALLRHRPVRSQPVLAMDFSHPMLLRGAAKFTGSRRALRAPLASGGRRKAAQAIAIEADALHLPLADNSVDLITTAFGFRNLANYGTALEEFHRVLRPGGELGILDFSEPGGLLGKLYAFYFRNVLPAIGKRLSGDAAAYTYLPASVENFPAPAHMLKMMSDAGLGKGSWTSYTFGVAGLYHALKD